MREEVKERIIKHLNFLKDEIADYFYYKKFTWEIYRDDRNKRREIERWIENLINSSIDISKLILTAEGKNMPDTYKQIVLSLGLVKGFSKKETRKLANWVHLRNIVAHEYLDIRWYSIKQFVHKTEPLYKSFFKEVKRYIGKKLEQPSDSE